MKIDVLNIAQFLSPEQCSAIISEIRDGNSVSASVSGVGDGRYRDELVRKAEIAAVSSSTVELVERQLMNLMPGLSEHFGVELRTVEPPQFLHYRSGDYFVAHQDGNTPLINDDTLHRKVSVIVFLNEPGNGPGCYDGGSLVFHGKYPDWEYREPAACSAGSLAAFPSDTTHEVLPVEAGERFTIASWFRS